jgi:hypothetical protein
MCNEIPCCSELIDQRTLRSPFSRIIALGWYDGPTAGLLQCGACSREYRFELLDELFDGEDEQDLRVYSLAPLVSGSVTRLTDALSRYELPRIPIWVPHWEFPTEAEKSELDRLSDQILDGAGPPELVIATPDLSETIVATKTVTPEDLVQITDWFSYLGLVRPDPAPPPRRAST